MAKHQNAAKRSVPDPRLLSVAEASTFLNVPEATLAGWRFRKRGPAFMRSPVNRRVYYSEQDLQTFLEQAALRRQDFSEVAP